METIKPKELMKFDPNIISFITLNNGKVIKLETSILEEPNKEKRKNDLQSKLEIIHNNPFKISKKIIINFEGKQNDNNKLINPIIFKNDFNKISKIIKNINFSYFGKLKSNSKKINNQNNINNLPKNLKKEIIDISNKKRNNIFEYAKTTNNFSVNKNTKSQKIFNKKLFEENKEENSINDRIRNKSKNCKERIEKLINDINTPTVNAVISLDIRADFPSNITGIQKQFNMLMTQYKRKKNKYKKNKGNENYQRYYELYKNQNNKVYNGTFNHKRLKYFGESNIENENSIKLNRLNKNNYKTNNNIINKNNNNPFNTIIYNNYINEKKYNNNRNGNYYSLKEMNEYKSKNDTISSLLSDKNKTISEKASFKDKVNKKVKRHNSEIIYPSNNYYN